MYSPQDLAEHVKMHPLTVREYLDDFDIPTPGWRGWEKNEFDEIVQIILDGARKNSKIQIKVGADPEFEVRTDTGNVVGAYSYFSGSTSQVGLDGASSTGELRPRPGSPERVTSNIRKLITKVKNQLPSNYNIGSGAGNRYPLGGHIHISGRTVSEQLLDKFEIFITEPLKEKSNTNVRGNYAQPRSWRRQPHGWEYRSPCSWLAHPVITRGALVIAYALCEMSDEDLEKITAKEDLILALGIVRGRFAKEFWEFLETTTSLESIDVFRAWQLETTEVLQEQTIDITPSPLPIGTVAVEVTAHDDFMEPFLRMGLHTSSWSPVNVVGARRSRSPRRNVILVPASWDLSGFSMPSDIQETWCSIERWSLASIGLSRTFRKKVFDSSWRNGNAERTNSRFSMTKRVLQRLLDTSIRN